MPDIPVEAMFDPGKYGYKECAHCNGHGSSFKDPVGVDTCTRCGGSGLVKEDIDAEDHQPAGLPDPGAQG